MYRISSAVVLSLVVGIASGQDRSPSESPRLFSAISFEEAMAQAEERDVLVIADMVYDSCDPCRRMNETTWVNESIEVFVRDNAVALQIDMDAAPELAEQFDVGRTHTILVFRNGEELDRYTGYIDPGDALAWLDAARTGQATSFTYEGETSLADDMRERLNAARSNLYSDRLDEALEEILAIWEETGREGQWLSGMREYELASDLGELATLSDDARARIAEVRAETEDRLREDPNWRDLGGWIVLSDVLDDPEPVFAWVGRNKGDEEGRKTIRYFAHLVEPMLLEHGRWADYGLLVENPAEEIFILHMEVAATREIIADEGEEGGWGEMLEEELTAFIEVAANSHAALLAAGRDAEAWELADAAVALEDTARLRAAIVKRAIEIGEAREEHRAYLSDTQADLRRSLDEAIR